MRVLTINLVVLICEVHTNVHYILDV